MNTPNVETGLRAATTPPAVLLSERGETPVAIGTNDSDWSEGRGLPAAHDFTPIIEHARLKNNEPIPALAKLHLNEYGFRAPENVKNATLWYEGTFDPLGPHHLDILMQTLRLGFERATLAIVFQNPYKPNSSAYEHRFEMARRALVEYGLPVVHDPKEKGICLFKPGQEEKFHFHRMNTLFSCDSHVLIGPDNFDKAMTHNVLWVHPSEIRDNPAAHDYFGFRSLYEKVPGFRRRLLVYPVLHDMHSTNLRTGEIASLPIIQAYATDHKLYEGGGVTTAPVAPRPITKASAKEVLSAEHILHRNKVERILLVGLSKLGLLNEDVSHAVSEALAELDRSELMECEAFLGLSDTRGKQIQTALAVHDTAGSPGRSSYHRPVSSLRTIRDHVSNACISPTLQIHGSEQVSQSFEQGKRIIFVGNLTGWAEGDLALLPCALRERGMTALADQMSFIMRDSQLPSGVAYPLFAKSAARILVPELNEDVRAGDKNKEAVVEAVQHGIRRLIRDKDRAIFYSPDARYSTFAGVAPFSSTFAEVLQDEKLLLAGDADNVVIVPVAMRGGPNCSEETPPMVSFADPIPLSVLRVVTEAHGTRTAAHVVGTVIADMHPVGHRGAYGDHADRFGQAEGPGALEGKEVKSIKKARDVVRGWQAARKNAVTPPHFD